MHLTLDSESPAPPWRPAELTAVALLVVAAGLHQALLWGWEVEDAAISFAYARNLVAGLGPVHYAGAEPVEGFSNPSWVGLLALLQLGGLAPFSAARVAGLVLGSLAVLPAAALGRRLGGRAAGLLAALLLAGSSHHAIWGGSGLENPLFTLALLAGAWSVAAHRDLLGGLLFALLGLTRPEGAMYGLLAAGWLLAVGPRRLLRWLPAWLLPLGAYLALRLVVFAWPLPNTFYAKRGMVDLWQRLQLHSDGVQYLLDNLVQAPVGLLLPLVIVGLWGRDLRLLLGLQLAAGAFFVAWSGGDWMKGARWISLLVPLLVPLAALGLARLASLWTRARVPLLVLMLMLASGWSAWQVQLTRAYAESPEQSPTALKRRVQYFQELAQDLWLEHPTFLGIDMGATTMWSGMRIVDYGRLVDLPMAHHRYDPALLQEYLFSWHHIDLAHLHGKWARRTGITRLPRWRTTMVEVEGYPLSRPRDRRHQGIWVRREHLAPPRWQREPKQLEALPELAPGLVLVGGEVHGGLHGPGERFLLDIVLARLVRRVPEPLVEVQLLDADSKRADRWTLLAGRAWFPPSRWEEDESVRTRVGLELPRGLAPGRYQLLASLEGGRSVPLASLEVGTPEQATAARAQALASLVGRAASGDCEAAATGWDPLRLQLAGHVSRTAAARSRLAQALGTCFRERAGAVAEATSAVDVLGAATWQPKHRDTRALVHDSTALWMQRAARLREEGRLQEAFELYGQVLRADPTRSWARRYREELRAELP